MTIRGIAARPERNSQGLWISVSCGVRVTACRFVGSFDADAVLELRPASDQRDEVGGLTARQRCCANSLQVVRQWVLRVLLT